MPYQEEVFQLFFPHLEQQEATVNRIDHSTAKHFLRVLRHFRRLIAQDVAFFIVKGRQHDMFSNQAQFPEFQTDIFKRYVEDMRTHLDQQSTHPSTLQQSINRVLPQVGNQFHQMQQLAMQGTTTMSAAVAHWGETNKQAMADMEQLLRHDTERNTQRILAAQ